MRSSIIVSFLFLLLSAQVIYCQVKGGGVDVPGDTLQVYIPNAFTPNGDGYNDYWVPVISGPAIERYEVVVIDRNGKEAFRSNDPQRVWNGSVKSGEYVSTSSIFLYYMKINVQGDLENKVYKGHITLVR